MVQERLVRTEVPHHPENELVGRLVEYLEVEIGSGVDGDFVNKPPAIAAKGNLQNHCNSSMVYLQSPVEAVAGASLLLGL
jgi:hypothetical protein